MRTKTVSLYTFDELSEAAKETARQWYRESSGPEDFEFVIEDAVRVLEILGVAVQTHDVRLMGGGTRRDPNIWWQVGYMQSDGACFEGTYAYAKGAHRNIRKHAPQDAELHRIADALRDLQRKYRYQVAATVRHGHPGFWPELTDVEPITVGEADYKALKELFRDLCTWIYQQLRTEDEYRSADEQIDENLRENGYEFDEHGNRED